MALRDNHQLDAARQRVAKVKARAKPWKSILALVLALIAAVVSAQARHVYAELTAVPPRSDAISAPLGKTGNLALGYSTAAAFFLLASAATIGLGTKARDVLQPSLGSSHAGIIRFAILVAGGLCTIIVTLQLFGLPVTQLVVGGALTGVLVGIAAQQSLANVFAGIVLLMARPFQVGDEIGIRSGALAGLIEGTVTEVSVTYVRLDTANGPVHLPNSQVLAAAVGPAGALPSPPGQPAPPAGATAAGTGAPGTDAAVATAAGTGAASPPAGTALPAGPGGGPGPAAALPGGTQRSADPPGATHQGSPDAQGTQRDAGRPEP